MRISDWSSDVCSSDLIQKLNQATSYYIRVRSRRASGVAEPWSIVYPFRTPVNAAQVTTPAAVMVQTSIFITPVPTTSITSAPSVAGFAVDTFIIDAPTAWRTTHAKTHTSTSRTPPDPNHPPSAPPINIPQHSTS